jgi:uncharacterized membrane protein
MIYRMGAATMSLLGLFLSVYLYLYKIGRIGTLACGSGGCETVQQSVWSRVGGIEVSLIGILGYATLLTVGLVGLQPGLAGRRWPAIVLTVLAGIGVLFTGYLTSLELFVIHAICRWCVGSAVIIVAVLAASLLDLRRAMLSTSGSEAIRGRQS